MERTYDVQKTSWTPPERLTYVQFTSWVQGVLNMFRTNNNSISLQGTLNGDKHMPLVYARIQVCWQQICIISFLKVFD